MTANQVYIQSPMNPLSNTNNKYPYNTMNRSFMADRKMTFEEKYNVYNTQMPVMDWIEFQKEQEDLTVPPSLEEDPNQHSPLRPDMMGTSVEQTVEKPVEQPVQDDLDAYIKQAEELAKQVKQENEVPTIPVIQTQTPELWSATLQILEAQFREMTVKELKEEYAKRWGTRDISHNNNKKNLIDLILELIINGTQKEEDSDNWDTEPSDPTTTDGQDGSADSSSVMTSEWA